MFIFISQSETRSYKNYTMRSVNPINCIDLLCPSLDHPFHERCHIESHRMNEYWKEVQMHKENIPPDTFRDFEIRKLTLSLLFYECSLEHEFEFYLQQIWQFNYKLFVFLHNRNTRNSNFPQNPLQENTQSQNRI